ncbi:MAG TPA: proton-conducting transporter membrane subunit, partial [Kofleriaceae bacterium]|nr:proton-conducting transporter membrane subunit [Kofleriaceae bacterium]
HLGFCMLGVVAMTTYGISGSIYAMLSHGLTTGGLFLGIGVLYERRHTRRLAEYGGIWKQMPIFAGLYLIIVMGSAGLPALSGFVGEFLTIMGTFLAEPVASYGIPMPHLLGALAATGVVLGAIYLLWMFQKVFFGKLDKAKNGHLPDLSGRELATFLPLVLGIFLMGMFPNRLLATINPSVKKFAKDFEKHVVECDGPVHVYGTGCDKAAAERQQAEIQKNLDGVAKGAAEVEKTMGAATAPPAAPAAPAGSGGTP